MIKSIKSEHATGMVYDAGDLYKDFTSNVIKFTFEGVSYGPVSSIKTRDVVRKHAAEGEPVMTYLSLSRLSLSEDGVQHYVERIPVYSNDLEIMPWVEHTEPSQFEEILKPIFDYPYDSISGFVDMNKNDSKSEFPAGCVLNISPTTIPPKMFKIEFKNEPRPSADVMEAVAMSLHPRLGRNSPLNAIGDLLPTVLEYVD